MNFFSKTNEKVGTLIVDIRSSGIGIMITHHEDKKVEVVYASRFMASKDNNEMLHSDTLQKTLDQILSNFVTTKMGPILTKNKVKIKKVNVVFAAPWYEATLKQINLKKEETFMFTKEIYNNLLKNEPLLANEISGNKKTIEKKIVHVRMNDYELLDPFDKPAKDIDIDFYIGQVDLKTLENVSSVLTKHFSAKNISYHTHGFSIYNTLRNTFVNLSSFVFLDVSTEVTEIGIVKNNVLSILATIPLGKRQLVESFAKSCNLDYQNALSSLNMITKGDLDDKCTTTYGEVLKIESQKWSQTIKDLVKDFDSQNTLPSKIFVLSDQDIQSTITSILKSESLKEDVLKGKSGDIIEISTKHFSEQLKLEEGVFVDPLFTVEALSTEYI